MSILKEQREKIGYTQIDLSEKTGLSLRTIQRLEAGDKAPKGYTLTVLSDVFNIEPTEFQEKFLSLNQAKNSDTLSIKLINLSVLAFFGFPFGNIILPIIMWNKKRQSKLVDEAGRKIINFQIIWSLLLSILLIISPFINNIVFPSVPLILVVLFTALTINLIVVGFTAISLHRNNLDFLNLPIRFL